MSDAAPQTSRPQRQRLPDRRECELINFRHDNFDYTASIGRFADGALAEVFLNSSKAGTTLDSVARDAAIIASIALQFGATAETIRHSITRNGNGNGNGTASGPLGTLLDLLAVSQ